MRVSIAGKEKKKGEEQFENGGKVGKHLSAYIGKVEDGDYMLVVSTNQQEHGGIAGEGEARH